MNIIKRLIKKRIMILEYESSGMTTCLNSQFALFPKKYHEEYRKSFEYWRLNAAIKLWELKIQIWKALLKEKIKITGAKI